MSVTPAAQDRPNVVVFLTDDHAQWATHVAGNREVRTPTLDYLAETGVTFQNAFTPTPVCSPARASFWTGRMPSQHGVHDYLAESDPEVAAVPWLGRETSLAARFAAAGYVTAMVGKWHLGPLNRTFAPFDYWFNQVGPPPTPTEFESDIPGPAEPVGDGFDQHAIADHAVNFLRRRDPDRPFLLFVGYFATHSPWTGQPERLAQGYRSATFEDIPDDTMYPFGRPTAEALYPSRNDPREALAQYYAAVTLIDEQVGRVVDELDALALRDDTVIVYTSDHGLNAGHHGLWGKGNATYPYNMLEESIRIPMIANAPGRILPRQTRAEPVTLCDLHDAVLDVAGIDIPAEERERLRLPGRSLLSLCVAEAAGSWPREVFGEYGDLRMIRTDRYKLIRRGTPGSGELFDLRADPRETRNLLDDSDYREVLADLDRRLTDYFAEHEDPEMSGLRVAALPRHNRDEAWREDGVHRLVATADWMAQTALDVQQQDGADSHATA